jgi:hypothetical protein
MHVHVQGLTGKKFMFKPFKIEYELKARSNLLIDFHRYSFNRSAPVRFPFPAFRAKEAIYRTI